MFCLHCSGKLEVVNSRAQTAHNQVWRRRQCLKCRRIYTSHEAIDLSAALQVSHGAKTGPFERDKLFLSVYNSCRHRSTAAMDAKHLTQTTLGAILAKAQDGVIPAEKIIELVSQILRRFDAAAAVQYRAFHKAK